MSRIDTGEWFEVDAEEPLSGASAILLRKLRERASTWRALAVTAPATFAWFTDGWLHALVDLHDPAAKMMIGCLRLEISAGSWRAAWVSSSHSDHEEFSLTDPMDAVGESVTEAEAGAEAVVNWLEEQLRRPVVRRTWWSNGELTARSWRLDDTGRELVVAGPLDRWGDPTTADEAVQVRP